MSIQEMVAKGITTVAVETNSAGIVLVRHPERQTTIYQTLRRSESMDKIHEMKKAGIDVIF